MDDLSRLYIVEKEHIRAEYYNDKNEEGIFIVRDIFFPAATELDILGCEETLKCQLPKSYRNFLLFHDGALLRTLDPKLEGEVNLGDWMYAPAYMILMSSKYLPEFTKEQMELYFDPNEETLNEFRKSWANLICFSHSAGQQDGDFYAFDPMQGDGTEFPVLYCNIRRKIEDWRSEIYYKSFKDFFIDVLDSTETGRSYDFLERYLKSLEEDT